MAKIDARTIIPPAEYPSWIKDLVAKLNADKVGEGVEHVRRIIYAGPFAGPSSELSVSSDYYVRFKSGSDGHSARLLAGVIAKGYGWFWMKYFLWPALLAQGQDESEVE